MRALLKLRDRAAPAAQLRKLTDAPRPLAEPEAILADTVDNPHIDPRRTASKKRVTGSERIPSFGSRERAAGLQALPQFVGALNG
jgi:hypothetical protein